MSIGVYDKNKIGTVVNIYRANYSVLPEDIKELYVDEDGALLSNGYVKPVQDLRELLSSLFRFSSHKIKFEIKTIYKKGTIEALSINEIAFLITDILISEKFRSGLFATLIMNKVIDRVVERLSQLSSVDD